MIILLEDVIFFDSLIIVKYLKLMLLLYGLFSDEIIYIRYISIECYVNEY